MRAFCCANPNEFILLHCPVCRDALTDEVAVQLGEIGLRELTRRHGRNTSVVGYMMSRLGNVVGNTGDAKRALPLCADGLAIVGATCGTESVLYEHCLTNLSTIYTELGEYVKARDLLEEALAIDEQYGREEDIATVTKNLGYAYFNLEQYYSAKNLLERALVVFERMQGPQGSDTKRIRADLADCVECVIGRVR